MAKPFVKWAGGKGKLVPQLVELLPADVDKRRHVEPFLGGGALFFARSPKRALLSDINKTLMLVYQLLALGGAEALDNKVREYLKTHDATAYYLRRDIFNNDKTIDVFTKTALFLYLNRTCFNGLYRENAAGKFNVPCGDYANPLIEEGVLEEASRCLHPVRHGLFCRTFREALDDVRGSDFLYLDPPYDGTFTTYVKGGFDEADQEELAERVRRVECAFPRLCFMLSNSDTRRIRRLYKGYDIVKVKAPRAVGASAASRGQVTELVVRNYV